jgi:hypothetical protein
MIRMGRLRQRFRGSFLKQPTCRAPLGTKIGQAQPGRPLTSDDNQVDSQREEVG